MDLPPPAFPPPPGPGGSPPPEFARRRREAPLDDVELAHGARARLAVRYRDVAAVLAEPAFSRALRAPGSPRKFPGLDVTGGGQTLTGMDPPEHTRLRRLVQPAVSPARAERWRPLIRSVADACAERLSAGGTRADLVAAYTRPYPITALSRLLGVPEPDHDHFQELTGAFLSTTADSARARVLAVRRLLQYVDVLIEQRRAHPGEGPLDVLLTAHDQDGRLSGAELRNTVFALFVGGYETTSTTLGRGVLALLRHPDAYRELVEDDTLVPGAVEEILRCEVPDDGGLLRRAVRAVALPSGTVREDETVLPSMCSANRDPEVFPDPDRFDIRRSPNPHLTFGAGAHYCLGASVARVQLQEGLRALLARFPRLRLTVPERELTFTEGMMVRSVRRLPVAWDTAG